jgi:hypothetical protein
MLRGRLEWAKSMSWHGVAPLMHLLDRIDETGVRLSPRLFRPIPLVLNVPLTPSKVVCKNRNYMIILFIALLRHRADWYNEYPRPQEDCKVVRSSGFSRFQTAFSA